MIGSIGQWRAIGRTSATLASLGIFGQVGEWAADEVVAQHIAHAHRIEDPKPKPDSREGARFAEREEERAAKKAQGKWEMRVHSGESQTTEAQYCTRKTAWNLMGSITLAEVKLNENATHTHTQLERQSRRALREGAGGGRILIGLCCKDLVAMSCPAASEAKEPVPKVRSKSPTQRLALDDLQETLGRDDKNTKKT